MQHGMEFVQLLTRLTFAIATIFGIGGMLSIGAACAWEMLTERSDRATR